MTGRAAPFAAVIPVLDEADAIGAVALEVVEAGACCVLVVDGGSRDATRTVARAAGARVIDEPRRGYGRACLTGASLALSDTPHEHQAVAFLDGDGSCSGADIRALVDALEEADVALGRRRSSGIEAGAMPWHARLGNALVAGVLSVATGRRVHDLPPAKAIRPTALAQLRLTDAGYGWTVQFVARALAEPTIRVREVDAGFRVRRGGQSKVSGSMRASAHAGIAMVRVALQQARARPVVALMAKAPGAGHAKTRLALDLGDAPTASLWAAMLADTAQAVEMAAGASDQQTIVVLPRATDVEAVLGIIGHAWTPYVQVDPGLAAALRETFLAAFDRGTDRAIAVAGDVPSLSAGYVGDASRRLAGRGTGAVIGPSADGGYHLIGLRWRGAPRWWPLRLRARRRRHLADRLAIVFDGALGGASALASTREGLRRAGIRDTLLPAWADVDTVADLDALMTGSQDQAGPAQRTRAWIAAARSSTESAPDADR